MNNKLPKRKDTIYKEIEQFKDYEFTNCIAYEMYIRNKEVIELLNKCNFFRHLVKDAKIITTKEDLDKLFPEEETSLQKLKDYGFDYFSFMMYLLKRESITKLGKYKQASVITSQPEYSKLTDILSADELDTVCKLEIHLYNQEPWINGEEYNLKSNDEFLEMGNHLEWFFHESNLEIIKNAMKRKQVLNIKNEFSRPILQLPFTLFADIQLNINLPRDELIAYVKQLKDEFDSDSSIIKTPLELLGEDLNKVSNKKINKSLIADKFFIYDYVTARQEQIKEDNELKFQEYGEQVQEIRNNPENKPSERKIQLVELKKEFEENTNTRINELFEDIEDFTPATAKRYYYEIKPFIDDCKYKELITGTSSK